MTPTKPSPTVARDLRDPTNMALELTEQRGSLAMLARETSSSMQNLTSSMNSMQAEVRHVSSQLGDVARLQQEHIGHSEGLGRAFIAIEKLAGEFSGWREAHERDNRAVADRVTTFRGAAVGFGVVATILLGLVVWIYQSERQAVATAMDRLGTRLDSHIREVDKRQDGIEERVREIQMTEDLK